MYERNKRIYKYRERPYDYRENLIREESRNRKIRKQLVFSENEYLKLKENMLHFGTDNFSEYVRYCIYHNNVTKDKINIFKNNQEKNIQRKQICFNEEEITIINRNMEQLDMYNLNLYIKLITIYTYIC